MSCVNKITKYTSEGLSFKDTWDFKVNDDLVEAAAAFMEYFNFNIFVESINKMTDPSIRRVLTQLC